MAIACQCAVVDRPGSVTIVHPVGAPLPGQNGTWAVQRASDSIGPKIGSDVWKARCGDSITENTLCASILAQGALHDAGNNRDFER
ncbi:hypothetical protein [Jiella endophytica]|uniref:hypothetical protein n=1 Tax=Jiella endophytica TaxID=2558362 RepID=UPI00106FA584|nr:hypothetical protein [Jiella endophytica]